MKQALVNDQLVPATTGAPSTATCPNCDGVVELRNRQGTYFWRHIQLPRGGCQPEQTSGSAAECSDDTTTDDRWTRQVGNVVIELHPDEHCLTLRSLNTPSEMRVALADLNVLIDALQEASSVLARMRDSESNATGPVGEESDATSEEEAEVLARIYNYLLDRYADKIDGARD